MSSLFLSFYSFNLNFFVYFLNILLHFQDKNEDYIVKVKGDYLYVSEKDLSAMDAEYMLLSFRFV